MCDKIGHFAFECKLKQKALALEAAASSGFQQHSFDNPTGSRNSYNIEVSLQVEDSEEAEVEKVVKL